MLPRRAVKLVGLYGRAALKIKRPDEAGRGSFRDVSPLTKYHMKKPTGPNYFSPGRFTLETPPGGHRKGVLFVAMGR
jgi:hypothetical protein